jgi:preprotein translocase subunit SecG
MLTAFFWVLYVLFFILCLFLILLVLIQKGRGGGLSSAFGGGGGNTAFGSKTGDVLTWATSIVFGVFMLLAIGLNLIANKQQTDANAAHPSANKAPSGPIAPPPDNGM